MPKMGSAIYAAHMGNVLKLASRAEGVSRPQLMKELNVSRPVANGLIEKCKLTLHRKEGRTEFFITDADVDESVPETPEQAEIRKEAHKEAKEASAKQSKPELPPEVKAVAEPQSDDTGEPDILAQIAELDAQVMDARTTLHAAAEKAGEALGVWATQSAMVDALRKRLADLAVERMKLSL